MPRKPSQRRSARRQNKLRSGRRLQLESLESRVVLAGDMLLAGEGEGTISLSLFVSGQEQLVPANIGVQGDGSQAQTFTTATDGTVFFTPDAGVTLETFFDTWRLNAGLAGNNANAALSSDAFLGSAADATNVVKMFVNGEVALQYEDYVLQDGDAVTIAYTDNPIVSLNTNFGSIIIELFEDETPGTVDNFLNYVNDGDYIDTFFHRRPIPQTAGIDVLQGGGFTTPSTTVTSAAQFTRLPTDPPILNEFGISNTRGTISMAKTSDPNSATSQFFINVGDNLALDSLSNSGGFTAFGFILTLPVVDGISNFPTVAVDNGTFGEVPLATGNQLTVIQGLAGHSELAGIRYSDANGNGVRDSGENGIPNSVVYIDANGDAIRNAGEQFVTTDASGNFRMVVTPGTYTVRAEGTSGFIQTEPVSGYSATAVIGRDTLGLEFGESALSAPTAVDLVAAFDTGSASDDNVTNLNNSTGNELQFTVSGVTPGLEVLLLANGATVGSAVATADTVTITTNGTSVLGTGVRRITALQQSPTSLETSPLSPPLDITIDTTAPALINNIPVTAQVGVLYAFDATSTDDGQAGIAFGLVNPPAGMTIDAATGLANWTPTADQTVPQVVEVTVTDLAGNSSSLTIDVTVLGVITAFPNTYQGTEDQTLTVAAAQGLLNDDGDSNSGALSAQIVANPTNGSVTVNSDGSFEYTPNANFSGQDTFTYRANDATNVSNVALVTIDITAVDDVPQPAADSATTGEDQTLTVDSANGVLANDVELDGQPLVAVVSQNPANGSLTLNANGAFTYTPNANFSGSDSFTYTASDGVTTSAATQVSITVNPVNDAPVAIGELFTLPEDTTLTIGAGQSLLTNDTDVDSASLTVSGLTTPVSGTLALNPDGTLSYTPAANFFGTDSFTYVVNDGSTNSNTATVTLNITAVGDAPTAFADAVSATNGGLQVALDVLQNDSTAPDGNQGLSITSISVGSQGGTLVNEGNQVLYTAPLGFLGQETFTYTITDDDSLTSTATVTIEVTQAANSSVSGQIYIDVNGDGVRDGNEIGFQGSQVNLTGTTIGNQSIERSVLTDASGIFSFTELPPGTYELKQIQPAAAVDGSESFTFANVVAAQNSLSNIVLDQGIDVTGFEFSELAIAPELVTIKWLFASRLPLQTTIVAAVADAEELAGNAALAAAIRGQSTTAPPPPTTVPPQAVNDSYSVDAGTSLSTPASLGVLNNDQTTTAGLAVSVIAQPTNGSVTLATDGSFTYTPNVTFVGQDTFTYQLTVGQTTSNVATVTIDVQQVAGQVSFAVNETAANGTVVGTLSEANVVLYQAAAGQNEPNELQLHTDDHLSGNLQGSVVLIEYVDFQCPSCAAFSPIVEQMRQQFGDDLLVVTRHLPLNGIHANAQAAAIAAEAAGAQGAFDTMHDILFSRQSEWSGLSDPTPQLESYASELGLNLTQFRVETADAASLARVNRDLADATTLGLGSTPSFFLNGQAISLPASQTDLANSIQAEVNALTSPFEVHRTTGAITVRDTTLLNFSSQTSHQLNLVGTTAAGATSNITVTIGVNQITGSAPVAVADSYSIEQDQVLEVTVALGVLSNDSDVDGDVLAASVLQSPTNGTLVLLTAGQFVYTPAASFVGSDSFTYQATDGQSTASATVSITVEQANRAPQTTADTFSVAEDNTLSVSAADGVLKNDSDPDNDSIVAAISAQPANGVVTMGLDGAFTYTPAANFNGIDTFTYTAGDGAATSTSTLVSITVNPVNDAPVANLDEYHTLPNQSLVVAAAEGLTHNDTDIDGNALTTTFVTGASNGGVTVNQDGSFTYVPALDFVGNDSFIYEVSDGTLTSQSTATVSITAADLASFRLETKTTSGVPVSSVTVGDTFLVEVHVADDRTNGLGVQQAFLDLLYDTNFVFLNSNVSFEPIYNSLANANTTTAGLVNELGAARTVLSPTGSNDSILATMIFRADAVGTAVFTTDAADDVGNDVLLLRDPFALPIDQILFDSVSIDIVAAGAGEPGDFSDDVDGIMAAW
jgi:VCBS repeat-containing protein